VETRGDTAGRGMAGMAAGGNGLSQSPFRSLARLTLWAGDVAGGLRASPRGARGVAGECSVGSRGVDCVLC